MSSPQIYDINKTWLWNLQNAPRVKPIVADANLGDEAWNWCGIKTSSPLGITAGPLLNSNWLLHYASLGFDVLVYKTVRSVSRDCYDLPNLVPVESKPLSVPGTTVPTVSSWKDNWAVSFGMPSIDPEVWRRDVEFARQNLPAGKVLVVSVVATQDPTITDPQQSVDQLADDFALCAKWAMDSGAHGVEANFSCPNVATADGQLYQQPATAAIVARAIRQAIGDSPLVLKIGRVLTMQECESLVSHLGPHISGFAMTNSIAAKVRAADGSLLFDGQSRGICGDAIRDASASQIAMFAKQIAMQNLKIDLIGVGGISSAEHVRQYLDAGATSVGMATAAMIDPQAGHRIRSEWA